MRISALPVVVIVAAMALAGTAQAQSFPAGGPTLEEVSTWLRGQGLDTRVEGDRVQSGANGVSWDLTGFDCTAGRCRSWQFSAGFLIPNMPEGAVSRWNLERRYLKALEVPSADGPAVAAQYDVLITPGMTWDAMTEHMRLFASVAPLFAAEMGAIVEE